MPIMSSEISVADIPLMATVRLMDSFMIFGLLWMIAILNDKPFSVLYLLLALIAYLASSWIFKILNIYRSWQRGKFARHKVNIFLGWIMVIAMLAILGIPTGLHREYSDPVLLTWVLACPWVLMIQHMVIRRVASRALSGKRMRSVVMVGINKVSEKFSREIESDHYLFMDIRGYFDDRTSERLPQDIQQTLLLGRVADVTAYVRENHINMVFVCLQMSQQPRIMKLLDGVRDTTASIYFVPNIFVFDLVQPHFDFIRDIPVLSICETPFLGLDGVIKRFSDIILTCLLLPILLPLMTVVAVGVKLSSPGPVIFKQRRYGLNGEEFLVYKFRSMKVREDGSHLLQAIKNDRRVTPIGRYLRKFSLDELPQFINVLQGSMSIVGPRPHAIAHNELYRNIIKGYMLRHKVKPGITGWAQVSGYRGETETVEKMQKRIEHDIEYLRNWSLPLDLLIILKTALLVTRGEDAH
jgi:putative colanic acid biosynthesis UDP-glucose lipid carrier transferase